MLEMTSADMWIGIDSAPLLIDGVITGVLGIVIVLLFLTVRNCVMTASLLMWCARL